MKMIKSVRDRDIENRLFAGVGAGTGAGETYGLDSVGIVVAASVARDSVATDWDGGGGGGATSFGSILGYGA